MHMGQASQSDQGPAPFEPGLGLVFLHPDQAWMEFWARLTFGKALNW